MVMEEHVNINKALYKIKQILKMLMEQFFALYKERESDRKMEDTTKRKKKL